MGEKETIILNLLTTHLEYDFLEVFFTTDKIKLEEAIQLKLPEGLNKNKGIIINGRGPIWLYLILYRKIKKANAALWVAQFDPQLHGAARVESNDPANAIIDKSEFEIYYPVPPKNIVIAFIGPPQSGKSVFLYTLFKQLLKIDPIYTNKNIFLIKGCPDGEGLWTSELPVNIVKKIRYKNDFTEEFVGEVLTQIENTKKSKMIIFVDCGGKIDASNDRILSKCSHAILISSDPEKAQDWRSRYPGIKYLADIESYKDVPGKVSKVKSIDPVRGTFYMDMINLDRGNPDVQIPKEFLQFFLSQNE